MKELSRTAVLMAAVMVMAVCVVAVSDGLYADDASEAGVASEGTLQDVYVGGEAVEGNTGETASSPVTVEEALALVASGGTISLVSDVVFEGEQTISKSVTFELNGHTLTFLGINIIDPIDVIFRNGSLYGQFAGAVNEASLYAENGGAITLDSVDYYTESTGIYVRGDASEANVLNGSTIEADGYCIGTNAAKVENYNVRIFIDDSKMIGSTEHAGTALCINVPCEVRITNSIIEGYMQGMILRGGTAVVKNCTITNTMDDDSLSDYFDTRNWGSGNTVNLAAITLGNKSTNAYQYPTDLTLIDSVVTSAGSAADAYPAIYAIANEGDGLGVRFVYYGCTVNGDITYGRDGDNIVAGEAKVRIGDDLYLTEEEAAGDLIPTTPEEDSKVTVDVNPQGGNDAVISTNVADIISESGTSVVVNNGDVSVELPTQVITNLSSQAGTGSSITITVAQSTRESLNSAQLAVVPDNAQVLEFTAKAGADVVSQLGGRVLVTFQYDSSLGVPESDLEVFYVDTDGGLHAMGATCSNGTVSFYTDHFSHYIAADRDIAGSGSSSQPSWDDDEDLPPFIPTQPAEDDNTVTIVACAAAAAVAAIMAVFLIIDRKG